MEKSCGGTYQKKNKCQKCDRCIRAAKMYVTKFKKVQMSSMKESHRENLRLSINILQAYFGHEGFMNYVRREGNYARR